jgi:hypothetical protein
MRGGQAHDLPAVCKLTRGNAWDTPVANRSMTCSLPAALKEAARLHPHGRSTLWTQVASRTWPTPRAADGAKNTRTLAGAQKEVLRKGKGADLHSLVLVEEGREGFLNPEFVTWLMGFPPAWTHV